MEYLPYFDAYPDPPLPGFNADITNDYYGSGSSDIISNANWGIYASKLGLGQGLFEAAGWSGAAAPSVHAALPWVIRGGQSGSTTSAGIERLGGGEGAAAAQYGLRPLVLGLPREAKVGKISHFRQNWSKIVFFCHYCRS